MSIREQNRNYSVELVVKNDPVATFEALKQLQELGYACLDSTIVYKNVRVPAGYCTDFQNFIVTHGAIVSGDHASIFEQVPEGLDKVNVVRFLGTCSLSLEKCARPGLTQDDVINYLQYRESQKRGKGQR